MGLPRWYPGKEPACQCRSRKRREFDPWVGKIPWRREWEPSTLFLLGKSHGQRSLAGYSPRGRKESDTTEDTHVYCIDSVQSLSRVRVFATPWTAARRASPPITIRKDVSVGEGTFPRSPETRGPRGWPQNSTGFALTGNPRGRLPAWEASAAPVCSGLWAENSLSLGDAQETGAQAGMNLLSVTRDSLRYHSRQKGRLILGVGEGVPQDGPHAFPTCFHLWASTSVVLLYNSSI